MEEDALRRALEQAIQEDWDAARTALDGTVGPVSELLLRLLQIAESRERMYRDSISQIRHELGNAISIALANLEGMLDDAVPTTPKRLQHVYDALLRARGLLQ